MRIPRTELSEGRVLRPAALVLGLSMVLALVGTAMADIPGRRSPGGTLVPLPGTQQQELTNITLPVPFNVFEFPGTCMACHGGTIDQQAAHGGNWAGGNMASATRNPVFRASQLVAESALRALTAKEGGSNMCWRCHSPNGWYSGRFDPKLGGNADGSGIIHSTVLSTDDEGVLCELCHRTLGAVTMNPVDGITGLPVFPADPAWNMMSGIDDWPHAGRAFPEGPSPGNPYGNGALQVNDQMAYGGKYTGSVEPWFSDLLGFYDQLGPVASGTYTGQTYGIYPWFYTGLKPPAPAGMPRWNANGDEIAYAADGSILIELEAMIPPDQRWSALSQEHGTWRGDFVRTPELCAGCHEQTVPVLNHGMPVQRTYTEWKYSSFSDPFAVRPDNTAYYARCQDCHMPTLMHEYSDAAPASVNPDPALTGWYPYAKDRNLNGGTTFHKLAGADRDLPMMMKVLYPEVDLELVGAPTGRDTRIFPGMQSSRDFSWDRARRNTEVMLRDAAKVAITSGPAYNSVSRRWEVKVTVTNNTGHKIPSGFPDGRRMWLAMVVTDNAGNLVYESGHYDPATATLSNDRATTVLTRALTPAIDGAQNAVMIYEMRTGAANGDGTYRMSVSPLNERTLFDNRIPPAGFTYAGYRPAGAKYFTYTGTENAAVPAEEYSLVSGQSTRYPDGRNWDEVTYSFAAPQGAALFARAELFYQSHTREQMEFLRANDNSVVRPEGPPSILQRNYPLTPTFLSDSFGQTTGTPFASVRDLAGNPLRDNWGGIAYAAWLVTGMGAPCPVAADDTRVAAPPPAPASVTTVPPIDPATGLGDPFGIRVNWSPVAGAEGYIVWTRYGVSDLTASWDRLAVVPAPQASFLNEGLNVAKTYAYKVQAFNAKGASVDSPVASAATATDLPLEPLNLRVAGVGAASVTLSWLDQASNELGFIIQRQDVPADAAQPLPPFRTVARMATPNVAGSVGVTFTDSAGLPACNPLDPLSPPLTGCRVVDAAVPQNGWLPLAPARTYNYLVMSFNASGTSVPTLPVAATTLAGPVTFVLDYDADRKTDVAVYRQSSGVWFVLQSSDGYDQGKYKAYRWGGDTSDIPVPGDYDGDGNTDLAVFRASSGVWYLLLSSTGYDQNQYKAYRWGDQPTDIPVPGDYDGDGKTDIAVWRPGDGVWYILGSRDGYSAALYKAYRWGSQATDIPVPGDYDGDGRTDIAVWRPGDGVWYILGSRDGYSEALYKAYRWGESADIPVPGDYDGDGMTDVAVRRPSNGVWYVRRSSDGQMAAPQWGLAGEIAVPGDYDGDRRTDVAVWRPSDGVWSVMPSSGAAPIVIRWGAPTDVPVKSPY